MFGYLVIFIAGIVSAAGAVGLLFAAMQKNQKGAKKNIDRLEQEHVKKDEIKKKIEALYSQMVDIGSVKKIIDQIGGVEEQLKAERGRITITQAELETVESRLRELEEIERELEASSVETREELKILEKKQKDLAAKNSALKEQIKEALGQLDSLISEIEMSTQMQEQILEMKSQLVQTEEKIDVLLVQIEQGNEQYFILKQRYDALDIEYAQLYEKFAEAESDDDDES